MKNSNFILNFKNKILYQYKVKKLKLWQQNLNNQQLGNMQM